MIDEFFARQVPHQDNCKDFKQTMEVLAKQGFKTFLGIVPEITDWREDKKSCSLVLKENPLAEFVVLPPHFKSELWYSNVIAGVIRGALEMINLKVKV